MQLAAAGVEGEVLGHARGAAVLEAELVAEVGRNAGVAPGLDRDGVLLDQADRRDGRGRAEDRPREPPQLRAAEHERAAEQVGGHRSERVPRGQEDRVGAGLAVQHVLRDQRVEDDEPAEREREQVDEPRPERQRAGAHRVDRDAAERRRQQQLLPRLDHVEREARDAGAVEQRHGEVVEREPDGERVERQHRPAPDGDEPDGQRGQVDEERERRGHQARPRRRKTSVANRYGASGPVSRARTRRPRLAQAARQLVVRHARATEGGGAVGAAAGKRERSGPGSAPEHAARGRGRGRAAARRPRRPARGRGRTRAGTRARGPRSADAGARGSRRARRRSRPRRPRGARPRSRGTRRTRAARPRARERPSRARRRARGRGRTARRARRSSGRARIRPPPRSRRVGRRRAGRRGRRAPPARVRDRRRTSRCRRMRARPMSRACRAPWRVRVPGAGESPAPRRDARGYGPQGLLPTTAENAATRATPTAANSRRVMHPPPFGRRESVVLPIVLGMADIACVPSHASLTLAFRRRSMGES